MSAPTTNRWVFWSAEQLLKDFTGDGGHSFIDFAGTGPLEETTTVKHGPSSARLPQGGGELWMYHMDIFERPWDDGTTPGNYTSSGGSTSQRGGCWYRTSNVTAGTSNIVQIVDNSGTSFAVIRQNNSGDLELRVGSTTAATHSSAISADTWYYIEWSVVTDGTSQTQRLWLDGTLQSGSAASGSSQTCGRVEFMPHTVTSENNYYECPWIAWETQTAASFTNPASATMDIDGDGSGSFDQWTGTSDSTDLFNNVDDNQDANYNNTSNQFDTQTHSSSQTLSSKWSGTVSTYEAVFIYVGMHKRSAPSTFFYSGLRENGNHEPPLGTPIDAVRSTTAEHFARGGIDHERPGVAGNAWTEATMEAVEIRYDHEQSQSRELRCGYARMFVLVDIEEASAATSLPPIQQRMRYHQQPW